MDEHMKQNWSGQFLSLIFFFSCIADSIVFLLYVFYCTNHKMKISRQLFQPFLVYHFRIWFDVCLFLINRKNEILAEKKFHNTPQNTSSTSYICIVFVILFKWMLCLRLASSSLKKLWIFFFAIRTELQ